MAEQSAYEAAQLERYREYLHLLARLRLDADLQAKVDVSGVVQQTLLEAFQNIGQLKDQSAAGQCAWLRQILANNLLDEVRRFRTRRRQLEREQALDDLEASSAQLESWLAAEQTSPSRQAIRNEQLLALAQALSQLPAEQRQAMEMHHFQGMPLKDIAKKMERSKGAVAALLFRGVKALKKTMQE